ncbi:hypothetical protein A4R44_04706 [Amycolatopsis sp. M39]|nr:hypothetical protein A4R44_04706 [Amycolatopsis sp. M39]
MGAEGGYRLVAGSAMLLDDEEAVGLRMASGHAVTGIDEASVRALTKLERVLPSRLRRSGESGEQCDGPRVDPEALTVLATAIADRERLRFGYLANDGEATKRLVEPHHPVSSGRRWYLWRSTATATTGGSSASIASRNRRPSGPGSPRETCLPRIRRSM